MSEDRVKAIGPLQRAWLAGVFDSRVTIPQNGYSIVIECQNEALIRKFHETVGFGSYKQRTKKGAPQKQHSFSTLSMNDSRDLILIVAPFLTAERTTQVARILGRIERSPTWKKQNPEKVSSSVT